ncbi:MAG: hypothetical protein EBR09_13080 [Proteobacteria bacterium]|nr:hypothetical protein [Pseudomonadota bacterium]
MGLGIQERVAALGERVAASGERVAASGERVAASGERRRGLRTQAPEQPMLVTRNSLLVRLVLVVHLSLFCL